MFIHKDAVDSQSVLLLMKIGSILTLAGLGSSIYTGTLHMGAGFLEGLVKDRDLQVTLKLFVLALALWASISTIVGMILVYKYAEP